MCDMFVEPLLKLLRILLTGANKRYRGVFDCFNLLSKAGFCFTSIVVRFINLKIRFADVRKCEKDNNWTKQHVNRLCKSIMVKVWMKLQFIFIFTIVDTAASNLLSYS